MSFKQQIDAQLKSAMLGGDKTLVTTLRTLKSVVLYAEVASGKRSEGLGEQEVVVLLRKEAKKRLESAELFAKGGNQEKADAEMAELKVIEEYLPPQMTDDALQNLVDQAISEEEVASPQAMGKVIARVKQLSEGSVDGGRIATIVRERLQK